MKTLPGTIVFLFLVSATAANYLAVERRRWIKIAKCESSATQANYECETAFDGLIKTSSNGWAYSGKGGVKLPATVIFTLEKASAVNRIGIKFAYSNYTNPTYVAKKFQISLKKASKWVEPEVRVVGVPSAITTGSVVELKKARNDVDIAFTRELDITEVKLTSHASFNSNGNAVFTEFFVQNVAESGCTSVGGTQRNRPCIFPFVNLYSNAVHHACTTDFGMPPWCAMKVNNDGKMPKYNYIGFCNQTCDVEEVSTCYTMWSTKEHKAFADNNLERRTCIFPHFYKGKWHNECHKDWRGIPICATTVDDNGVLLDHGYCGPECPGSTIASQCLSASDYGARGKRCVFPGLHDKKYYLGCDGGWCPTSVDLGIKVVEKQWGKCSSEDSCDKDECITVGGAKSGEACKFPFRNPWTNEMHYKCTTAKLEENIGSKYKFASAPWCAIETDVQDNMVTTTPSWGFCSKKCPVEKHNNCYVDEGAWMSNMQRCIFPFIYKGLTHYQCTFVQGFLKCPIKIDKNAFAKESDMRPCGPSPACFNSSTVAGKPITVGYIDVGSYTNDGTKDLEIAFTFETGVEDTSESNWNVEASVSAGFDAFGASFEASLTAGGGGASAASSSSHQSHSLTYKCPAHTRVVLSQQVFNSGRFESRTFRLVLEQTKLSASHDETPTKRHLTKEEIFGKIQSINL